MKYIKKYENLLDRGKFWVIYGNLEDFIKILYKMKINSKDLEEEYDIDNLIDYVINKKDSNSNIIGYFIFLYHEHYTFKEIPNDVNFKEVVSVESKFADFSGELKIENDKLVLDTLPVDINKYNL